MTVKERQRIERRIVTAVIKSALAAGLSVDVDDGEEWALIRSTDQSAILKALFTTDEEVVQFHNAAGERVGTVYFVYGNDGYDVISDHSAPTSRCGPDSLDPLLAEANKIAEREEARHG